jgi:nitroreductase
VSNYGQLSFSEEELLRKGTGVLATMFPPSWRKPFADPEALAAAEDALVSRSLQGCPTLIVVLYDSRKRAPDSAGDALGIMSLGCVLQNMWLMAAALGIGMQAVSRFDSGAAQQALRHLLNIPDHMKIAFACRLGYPLGKGGGEYLRVRRDVREFAHHNRWR